MIVELSVLLLAHTVAVWYCCGEIVRELKRGENVPELVCQTRDSGERERASEGDDVYTQISSTIHLRQRR